MTILRPICKACAPESLERYPHLPLAHRTVISAIQNCRSGHCGPSRSPGQRCGEHHRVHHSWGHRPCPQCQQQKTPPWLSHHLAPQLPGPPFLITFPVPETLRPLLRSPQRLGYQAMFHASFAALKRLATDERCIGTALPGCTGGLHTWGRQLPSHPHIHAIVPGGGLSQDRTSWRPSRATFFVPVTALSPLSRALFKQQMGKAGLLERLAPNESFTCTTPQGEHRLGCDQSVLCHEREQRDKRRCDNGMVMQLTAETGFAMMHTQSDT